MEDEIIMTEDHFKTDNNSTVIPLTRNIYYVNYSGMVMNFGMIKNNKKYVMISSGISVWWKLANEFTFSAFIAYCFLSNVKTKLAIKQYKEMSLI